MKVCVLRCWFSFWFSGCWRALAKGTAWAGFYRAILLLLRSSPCHTPPPLDFFSRHSGSEGGRNEDSLKILGFWHFFVSRNPPNRSPKSFSMVSTSFTHSGDDEDSGDSGIISLFFLLESPESSQRIQLQNVCVFHCKVVDLKTPPPCVASSR